MIKKLVYRFGIFLLSIFMICFLIFILNEVLNSKIQVVYQEVKIENLPSEFEGFKIVQLSDLHGEYFSSFSTKPNQDKLIKLINSTNYDALAITGDMADNFKIDSEEAFNTLIEGLSKDKPIFYIEGNHGPEVIDKVTGQRTLEGIWLEEQGVNLLQEPQVIVRNNKKLWITAQTLPFKQPTNFEQIEREDILIGLMHYPMNAAYYEAVRKSGNFPEYDLILAGHYHGGQWRIPFYGAFFVSEVNGEGWFPNQDDVSGLKSYSGYQQYISRGLGASGSKKILKKRWFNQPEINILILKP